MDIMMYEQKKELVEKLGVHFEGKYRVAPLAARILSYVVLNGRSGSTFYDLVIDLCASKSTISTHLNHLQGIKRIVYFTKPGDRKKYFIINKDLIIQSLSEMITTWKDELLLYEEIMLYKENVNKSEGTEIHYDLDFHHGYMQFLKETIKTVTDLRTKIINRNQ
tara:strand:- start:10468 stop:10959 length:492 start_codon:yes stop_codon:yes gene_type:complete